MKKKAQVHMLPTNRVSDIMKHRNGNLYSHTGVKQHLYQDDYTYQYLYITTDDEIKESDNILEITTQRVGKYHYDSVYKTHDLITEGRAYPYDTSNLFRKIVASNNPELLNKGTIEDFYADDKKFALNISDQFIYDYRIAYNLNDTIKEVMLEYNRGYTQQQYSEIDIERDILVHDSGGCVITTPIIEKEKDINTKALEALVEELEKSGLRKYTCVNGVGYSQVERNIVDKILVLKTSVQDNVVLGVGDGSGKSFVQGDYDSIKVLQDKLLRIEKMYTREDLRKALWNIRNFYEGHKHLPFNKIRVLFNNWFENVYPKKQ